MTIEALVPIIVKALKKLPEPPWYVSGDDAADTEHQESGLALVDTGRTQDWPIARLCEWHTAEFIASSPLWLAQMVVEVIEARKVYYDLHTPYRSGSICRRFPLPTSLGQALSDFSLTAEDWEWLKGKVGE